DSEPIPQDRLEWRPHRAEETWRWATGVRPGIIELRHIEDSRVLFRTRLQLLPRGFSFDLEPGADQSMGALVLMGLDEARVALRGTEAPDMSITAISGRAPCRIELRSALGTAVTVPLSMQWPDGRQLLLELPFPRRGGRFIDRNNRALPQD